MSYRLPTFNLAIGIWHDGGTLGPAGAPDLVVDAQLRYPGRGPIESDFSGDTFSIWHLLVPALTDIRDQFNAFTGKDTVEVPFASNRFYWVTYVDDVAKGFDNEHRLAFLQKVGNWPVPMP